MKSLLATLVALLLVVPSAFAGQRIQNESQTGDDAGFSQVDGNSDGKVSLDEAQQVGITRKEFTDHDANRDNALDQSEYVILIDDRDASKQSSIQ